MLQITSLVGIMISVLGVVISLRRVLKSNNKEQIVENLINVVWFLTGISMLLLISRTL